MPAGLRHFPDPGIQYGAFRVLRRTDGVFAVVDERRKPGDRTVMLFPKLNEAEAAAKAWFEQGHGMI